MALSGDMGKIGRRYSHYLNESPSRPKMTIPGLRKLYRQGTPITMLTAHDYISGRIADEAGVDMVLVGDSLAMVALGYKDTNEIGLDEMIHHTRAVSRGVESAFLVADLPFGTYGKNGDQTYESAVAMVKRGKTEAVKLEGGIEIADQIAKITALGIPVCGHVGLTPQRQSSLGGFKVQGKTAATAMSVLRDAIALQEAGCFAMVLEAVPDRVGELVTSKLKVPTIGIGAGPGTSGQVLVQLDMLGGFDSFVPKFLKQYANMLDHNRAAIREYSEEVKQRQFPAKPHCYTINDREFEEFANLAEKI
ncbi:3-methyl-2-oxobutanoate hydroxymethyltransferase [Trichomonascus vanleenenianus]|uniref:3-methyl-2-oxobutanoate hydroxymethyltransferase n=1 Tax=Trichomonascus vanleenenianus TaxID=2268995 RepID=UPI003ECB1DAF